MNPDQKKLLIAIITYFIVWNARFLWEYLPGPTDMLIVLILLVTNAFLGIIGVYQVFRYFTEKPKTKFRLINAGLIFLVAILTYFKPLGLVDFRQFEGANILHAQYEGVANCTTSIRLKEGNRFKKTSICFGIDHEWGNYEIVADTVKFKYDNSSAIDLATLKILEDTTDERLGVLYFHFEGSLKSGLPLHIKELQREKLK